MHYSNAQADELLEAGRHAKDEAERKQIYGEFEKVYAENPGVLLVAYLDGNYVGTSAVDGLDTTRVLGHHAVGVMWNIEDWTITR
jgi:peptide/nickel transport system substrate-binding protein